MWAAYLNDPRLDETYRKQLAERDPDERYRPDLAGYDRHVEALHALNTSIAHLIRQMGHRTYPLPQGPLFPSDRFAIEDMKTEAAQLNSSVDAALQRGRERHA